MPRIRKAWEVFARGADGSDICHAPTASKARYQKFLDWRDCWPDLTLMDITVRRAAYADIKLPEAHRLVQELSPVERQLIGHSFGSASREPGYRGHYCAGVMEPPLLRLTFEMGIFDGPFGNEDEYGNCVGWAGQFFYLTDLGRDVARSMLPDYAA